MFEDFIYKKLCASAPMAVTGTVYDVPTKNNRGAYIFTGVDSSNTSYGTFIAVVNSPTGGTFALAPFQLSRELASPLRIFIQGMAGGATGQGVLTNQKVYYFPLTVESISNTAGPPSGSSLVSPTWRPIL